MYGGFGSWLYTGVAGLARAPGSRGWAEIVFRPAAFAHGALTSASASVATPVGLASISWLQAPPTPDACAFGAQGGPRLALQCVSKSTAAPAFSGVRFASYGLPTPATGCPGPFARNASCDDANSTAAIAMLCEGKAACEIDPSDGTFGGVDPCPGFLKFLAVQLDGPCDAAVLLRVSISVPVGSTATAVLPVGPGKTAAGVSVSETAAGAPATFVWAASAFVPGTPGVVGAASGVGPVGSETVVLTLLSGAYSFDVLG